LGPATRRPPRRPAFFYSDASGLPAATARALLGHHGAHALHELGLGEEIERLTDGDATVLTPDVQDRLSGLLAHALGMVEGLIWAGGCQVGRPGLARRRWCCLWFGVLVAGGRRGRFRLICEGWLPHDGASLRRGRGLESTAPAGARCS